MRKLEDRRVNRIYIKFISYLTENITQYCDEKHYLA